MTMDAKFEENYELSTVKITSPKTKNAFLIKRHTRFPSLWVIETTHGPKANDLQGTFTNINQAKNFMSDYISKMKYSVAAYADKRDAQKKLERQQEAKQDATNSKSLHKV